MTESVETIGIWEFHPDNAEADAARTAALEQLQLLKAPGIAFFFARSFLNRRIGQAFDSLPTKRFDTNGAANPNGAVHMTGISFDLNPPKQIVTYIDGFDDTTFPDTNFRISITDDLIINEQSALSCNESINMDTDTGVLEVLSGIFIPFVFELIAVELLGGAPQSTPADCWVQVLSQNDIPVSGGWDIVITYTDVNVTYEGLVLLARFPGLSKRTPSVEIIGRRNLTDNLGEGVVGSKYSAQLLDFLEPVQIEWFVDSNLVAKGTGEQFVTRAINFTVPRGKSVVRQLMVKAVDADNLMAEDKTSINISSRTRPSPPP